MDGWVRAGFEDVARVFRRQLRRTTGGAAVAVYHRGELAVDLWGGWRAEGQPWQRDTMAMCFSTTKGVISTALHLLAERGQIEYDAPVAAYWPRFAEGGKGSVTVRHVLTHSAGLHRMRTLVDHARRMLDWDYMVAALERAEPAYEPGTRHGYHALTYGWLAGELVRRVSGLPTARSLAKLYALLAHGGQVGGMRLLSPQTLREIAVVHSRGPDIVLVLPMGWRLGYHSAFTTQGTVPGAFGHFGFGGSGGWADPRRDVALAMVCNRGSGTPIGDLRMAELGAAVVRSPGVASPR